jgi:peptidoglycan/xylan/chitin deacetylase (PgdA/CDA1 family)
MSFPIIARRLLSAQLKAFGFLSSHFKRRGGESVILMYHRVIPKNKAMAGLQAGMYVEPETFDRHILYLREHFEIIPLSGLLPALSGGNKITNKPFCVLTFDDGWADFYEYAFPIIRKYAVPATVFLPTDYIGTGRCFWTDRLSEMIYERCSRQQESNTIAPDNTLTRKLASLQGSRERQLESAIQILKSLRNEEIEHILSELAAIWAVNGPALARTFLSWEEVLEMAGSGVVSFGSHSASHRILTTLSGGEVLEELISSKERLLAADVVNDAFIPFCYPNGDYNENIAKMVRDAGYSLAVTTRSGWNGRESDMFALNRIGLHEDMTSTAAMLGCRIARIFS